MFKTCGSEVGNNSRIFYLCEMKQHSVEYLCWTKEVNGSKISLLWCGPTYVKLTNTEVDSPWELIIKRFINGLLKYQN